MPRPIDKDMLFTCECGCTFELNRNDDPTTSTGCCKACGGSKWHLYDEQGHRL